MASVPFSRHLRTGYRFTITPCIIGNQPLAAYPSFFAHSKSNNKVFGVTLYRFGWLPVSSKNYS
jgi:hypothetical protein